MAQAVSCARKECGVAHIAFIRLFQAGLEIPSSSIRPYRLLEEIRDGAYAYYNALLDSLNSVAHVLELELRQQLMLEKSQD